MFRVAGRRGDSAAGRCECHRDNRSAQRCGGWERGGGTTPLWFRGRCVGLERGAKTIILTFLAPFVDEPDVDW